MILNGFYFFFFLRVSVKLLCSFWLLIFDFRHLNRDKALLFTFQFFRCFLDDKKCCDLLIKTTCFKKCHKSNNSKKYIVGLEKAFVFEKNVRNRRARVKKHILLNCHATPLIEKWIPRYDTHRKGNWFVIRSRRALIPYLHLRARRPFTAKAGSGFFAHNPLNPNPLNHQTITR